MQNSDPRRSEQKQSLTWNKQIPSSRGKKSSGQKTRKAQAGTDAGVGKGQGQAESVDGQIGGQAAHRQQRDKSDDWRRKRKQAGVMAWWPRAGERDRFNRTG